MIEARTRILVQAVVDEQKAAEKAADKARADEMARKQGELQERHKQAIDERDVRRSQVRALLASAPDLARKGDIDGAESAIDKAKSIKAVDDQALQGDEDRAIETELAIAEESVAKTPAAKRRAKEHQRAEAREKKAEEATGAGNGDDSDAKVDCAYQESNAPWLSPMEFEGIKVASRGDELLATYTLAPRPWDRGLPHPFSIKPCAMESALLTAGTRLLESHASAKRLTVVFDIDLINEDRFGNPASLSRTRLVRFSVSRGVQEKLANGSAREKGFYQGARAMLRTLERVVHPWYHPTYIVRLDR
jgi:hypothetical protein